MRITTILVLSGFLFTHAQIPVGKIPYRNSNYPAYFIAQEKKKIIVDGTDTLELKDIYQAQKTLKDSLEGIFSTDLNEKLKQTSDTSHMKVIVNVAQDQTMNYVLNQSPKPSRETLLILKRDLMLRTKSRLLETLQLSTYDGCDTLSVSDYGIFELTLPVNKIKQLKNEKWLGTIDMPLDEPFVIKSDMSGVYGTASGGGLAMSGFSAHGTNCRVGVVELGQIDTQKITTHLYNVPLGIRPGAAGVGSHGTEIVSMVRNSTGSTSDFTKGGAYSADSIMYAKMLITDSTSTLDSIKNAYQWVMDRSPGVINSSWGVNRYTNRFYDTVANKIDWYYDKWANENYILHVVSAGNSGKLSLDWQSCITKPYWDSVSCERVMKYGHNILAVGNLGYVSSGVYSMSGSSSWRNGPTNDEVPHVVAIGSGVDFPWGTYASGTSYSAAAISSFAASVVSTNSSLGIYPEVLKSIIMLSATASPSIDSERWASWTSDKKAGTGVPNAAFAKRMAVSSLGISNNDTLTIGNFGSCAFSFASTAQSGDTLRFYVRVDTTAMNVNFLTTWMSHPDHATIGTLIPCDDLDLTVFKNGTEVGSSLSAPHTSEYCRITHSGGAQVYGVRVNVCDRLSTNNHQIWVGCAWNTTSN